MAARRDLFRRHKPPSPYSQPRSTGVQHVVVRRAAPPSRPSSSTLKPIMPSARSAVWFGTIAAATQVLEPPVVRGGRPLEMPPRPLARMGSGPRVALPGRELVERKVVERDARVRQRRASVRSLLGALPKQLERVAAAARSRRTPPGPAASGRRCTASRSCAASASSSSAASIPLFFVRPPPQSPFLTKRCAGRSPSSSPSNARPARVGRRGHLSTRAVA